METGSHMTAFVGTRPIPKGIGRAIRRFVMFAFSSPIIPDVQACPILTRAHLDPRTPSRVIRHRNTSSRIMGMPPPNQVTIRRSLLGRSACARACAWQECRKGNVRCYGSFSDLGPRARDVGSTPVSGHRRPDFGLRLEPCDPAATYLRSGPTGAPGSGSGWS
jgi:hypothetical protein